MNDNDRDDNAGQSHAKDGRQQNEGEEEEAFTLVTRKKNGRKTSSASAALQRESSISCLTQSNSATSNNLPGWSSTSGKKKKKASTRAYKYTPVQKTLEWGLNTIRERRSALTESKFFQAFRDLVKLRISPPCRTSTEKIESHGLVESDQDKKTTNSDVESIEPVTRPVVDGMVCYGIGSFEESRNAQFQLSLALELRDLLEVKHKICIFDPVMTDLDKEIAKALDMQVLDKGEDLPANTANGTIIYFMPHCPKGLYSNILEKNWTRLKLDRTVILGNRFSMYHESPNYKTIAKQAPFIFAALPIAEEHALPAIKFEENTAFNDLAIHVFPPHFKLPEPDVTEREIDPELL